jgi:hypothetical protein
MLGAAGGNICHNKILSVHVASGATAAAGSTMDASSFLEEVEVVIKLPFNGIQRILNGKGAYTQRR